VSDQEDFLAWVKGPLNDAELALHTGDAAPRRALWSRSEPVSVLGALRNADGQDELDELFAGLAKSFSNCTSYEFELQAYGVIGDMAYTAGLEHTTASMDGQPRTYTFRATQVYRREDGDWRVAHRHGDTVSE
jgi:ketosteroid isomerase-like protein